MTDLAQEQDTTPFDVMLDLALAENLETRFWSVLANNDPDAIAELLPNDTVLLGLADSGAHVSQLCDACFATDLLGNWVREKDVMPLEHAIYKLTGSPRASSASPIGGRSRSERPPTSSCSTPTPWPRARCAASVTSRPTVNASSPTSRSAFAMCS